MYRENISLYCYELLIFVYSFTKERKFSTMIKKYTINIASFSFLTSVTEYLITAT